MRASKFTETQIITILKQGDAGLAVKIYVDKPVSARRRITSGRASTAGLRRPSFVGSKTLKLRTPNSNACTRKWRWTTQR